MYIRARHLSATFCLVLGFAACQGGQVELPRDPDGDGLTNAQEEFVGTNAQDPDTDDDGLNDGEEIDLRTDPLNPDSDGGGRDDGDEVFAGRDPLDPLDDFDWDSDGLTDADEIERYGTDPTVVDTDGDGLTDYEEVEVYGTFPLDPDSDDDALDDATEIAAGTDPLNPDTDGDGVPDDAELLVYGSDPTSADGDRDGLDDLDEIRIYGTQPDDADTDDDGLDDGREVFIVGSDPLVQDSDSDTLLDPDEFAAGTNPKRADTDGDGLSDTEETLTTGTDPLLADTDGDGLTDFVELRALNGLEPFGATDPLDPDTDGDGLDDGNEVLYSANPLVEDTDGDGLPDSVEVYDYALDPAMADTDLDLLSDGDEVLIHHTNPRQRDTDADGLNDGLEIRGVEARVSDPDPPVYVSDPTRPDTDGDGLSDLEEVFRFGTDPMVVDTDGDTLTDREEVDYGFDPRGGTDGTDDLDADGLTNREELDVGTHPRRADSDDDHLFDGDELTAATDPLYPDTDGDGLLDGDEWIVGVDPLAVDTDLDGIEDGDERSGLVDIDYDGLVGAADPDMDGDGLIDTDELRIHGTDERIADTDHDQLPDGIEIAWGLDPLSGADSVRDPDGDGLTNVQEYRRGSDPFDADTDGDGIPDGVEVFYGLNPASGACDSGDPDCDAYADFDGDGIINRDEVCPLGPDGAGCAGDATNLRSGDSDGDGLADTVDTVPNNADRDGDGLSDGYEVNVVGSNPTLGDTDGDGLLDSGEVELGGNAWRSDTDSDGLSDAQERDWGTDPAVADTDGDGLSDFVEVFRTDSDPTLADTDDDGVADAFEIATGTGVRTADTDGDGLLDGEERDLQTDPFAPDTDEDGIPDGLDPSPVSRDADLDGIPDPAELVEGYNGRIVVVDATGAQHVSFDLTDLPRGWFRVVLVAGPDTPQPGRTGGEATFRAVVRGAVTLSESTHAVRWDGDRTFSTPFVRSAAGELSVDLTTTGAVRFDVVALQAIEAVGTGYPAASVPTFADRFDSDDDGLSDGAEAGTGLWVDTDDDDVVDTYRPGFWSDTDEDGEPKADEVSPAFWLEAENHAAAGAQIVQSAQAGNGAAVLGTTGTIAFASPSGSWGYTPGVRYSVFVRARVDSTIPSEVDIDGCLDEDCPNTLWVTADLGDGSSDGCPGNVCSARIPLTNRFEWRFAGSFVPGSRFEVTMRELLGAVRAWELDRVAIVPMDFAPDYDVMVANATIAPEQRVPGIPSSGTLALDIELPWGLTDPGEADTDGDGLRATDAGCVVSPECPTGTIPGSAGWLTDGRESRLIGSNPFDIDSDHDADLAPINLFGIWAGDAIFDDWGPGRFDDANDPYPSGADRDLDGLSDPLELELWAACQAGYTGALTCPDARVTGATCTEVAPFGPVRCFFTDDDRDNDGLPDGMEDRDGDGEVDPSETSGNARDTDGDGLPDGVESGLGTALSRHTTDTGLWPAFTGDADPASVTNPLGVDTDGDQLCDGRPAAPVAVNCLAAEDLNNNGAFDEGSCPGPALPSCGPRDVVNPRTGAPLTYATPSRTACETDNTRSDTDGDGLSDAVELFTYCTSPIEADTDGDGLADRVEVTQTQTDPNDDDTDGDGLLDGEEVDILGGRALSDPLVVDTDGDGLTDYEELRGAWPSNPNLVDTDGDGLTDPEEVRPPAGVPATNPSARDSDHDTLDDFYEIYGEDANRNGVLDDGEDRDGDGVLDEPGTDPNDPDTDGDLFLDGNELRGGSDPLDEESTPDFIDDFGIFNVVPADGDFLVETDGGGAPTGLLVTTGSQIDLGCRDRVAAAYIDGQLVVDRSDPANAVVYADGDFYVRLPGGRPVKVWDGRTNFVGFATATGEPTNTATAVPDLASAVLPLSIVGDGVLDLNLTANVFFDLCNGEIGGFADWELTGGDWGFGASSEVALGTMTTTFSTEGRIRLESPIGDIYLVQAELELNVLDFYASGNGGMEIPGLQDVLGLFPKGDDVNAESTTCAICLDFTIDPVNGRFKFMPEAGYEMSIGPMTVSVDFGLSLPQFELDVPRGYFFLAGGFDFKSIGFEGSFAFDLSGQLEFERAATVDPSTCTTQDDCLYGQACVDGECLGCAAMLDDAILDRYEVSFEDDGQVGDSFEVRIDLTHYVCPGIGTSCPLEDRLEAGQETRTYEVIQNGRLEPDELANEMAQVINADTDRRCPRICDSNYRVCAKSWCPVSCRYDHRADACHDCAADECDPILQNCLVGCIDTIPVEAYINEAGTVIVEADDFMTGIEIIATYNDDEDEDFVSVEQGELTNGNLQVTASASIPLANPVFSIGIGGEIFTDFFPVANDGDPFFFAANGTTSIGAGFGPVGLSFEMSQSSGEIALDEQDEFDYLVIATSRGMTLDDLISGLPAGLGSIGNEQQMLVGYDADTMTLCSEARARFWGWDVPMSFTVAPPIDPVTKAFDLDQGGLVAAFRVNLPLQLGMVSGSGDIGWNGDFDFQGRTELQLIPGMTLAGGGFGINNDGAYLWGELALPGGLGRLEAYGEIDYTGRFDLSLDGNLTIAGFELANVSGRANNSGVEIHGRLQLPAGLATLEVDGWIREDGDFYLRGFADISIPGGTSLANAEIVLSPDGLSIDAGLNIPNVAEILVTGRVQSDGYILLTGRGSLGMSQGVRLGPVELGFERSTAGVYRIWGSGGITIAGHTIVDVGFSFGTDGSFSAHGSINLWIAWADISISKTAGGSFRMSATVGFEVCGWEHCISGHVSVRWADGVLTFEIGGGISGPILNFSLTLTVDSRGCFGISELGTFCL